MSKENLETTIDGVPYLITQHGPDEGDVIFAYLAKTVGPILGGLMGAINRDMADPEVTKGISGALSSLNGKEHSAFMRTLLSVCVVKGQSMKDPAAYTSYYTGRHAERYKAAAKVIEHGGFFELIGSAMDLMPDLPSSAPPTSNGASGDSSSNE